MERQRKPRASRQEIEQLEQQIVNVLIEDNPQSIRHVFYRMTDPRLPVPVEKTEQGYERVQTRIKCMREQGLLPYEWIVDDTRSGDIPSVFKGPGDFIRRAANSFRLDVWGHSNVLVDVWCESRSLESVVSQVCDRWRVASYACGGFASLTLIHDAAKRANRIGKNKLVVLYIGDYDPAGVLIDVAVKDGLSAHLDGELEMRRVAVNRDQIDLYDLPTKPRKESEKRVEHLTHTVEGEAMPPSLLRQLLEAELRTFISLDVLERYEAVEKEKQRVLYAMGDQFGR